MNVVSKLLSTFLIKFSSFWKIFPLFLIDRFYFPCFLLIGYCNVGGYLQLGFYFISTVLFREITKRRKRTIFRDISHVSRNRKLVSYRSGKLSKISFHIILHNGKMQNFIMYHFTKEKTSKISFHRSKRIWNICSRKKLIFFISPHLAWNDEILYIRNWRLHQRSKVQE